MDQIDKATAVRLIAFVCAAQVLVQIGAFFWPALVPGMMARWRLTNSEAGWITAAFYGAYMLAVPVLVTLTDRVDTRRVYLGGVAAMVAGHALFAALADGFWSAFACSEQTLRRWRVARQDFFPRGEVVSGSDAPGVGTPGYYSRARELAVSLGCRGGERGGPSAGQAHARQRTACGRRASRRCARGGFVRLSR